MSLQIKFVLLVVRLSWSNFNLTACLLAIYFFKGLANKYWVVNCHLPNFSSTAKNRAEKPPFHLYTEIDHYFLAVSWRRYCLITHWPHHKNNNNECCGRKFLERCLFEIFHSEKSFKGTDLLSNCKTHPSSQLVSDQRRFYWGLCKGSWHFSLPDSQTKTWCDSFDLIPGR